MYVAAGALFARFRVPNACVPASDAALLRRELLFEGFTSRWTSREAGDLPPMAEMVWWQYLAGSPHPPNLPEKAPNDEHE